MDVNVQKSEINGAVHLHIDELVLHGFALGDRYRIAEAMEQALSRLIANQGVPGSLANGDYLHQVDGGSFQTKSRATPETIGHQVASAVYGSLSYSGVASVRSSDAGKGARNHA
jgi:hypothetical protein